MGRDFVVFKTGLYQSQAIAIGHSRPRDLDCLGVRVHCLDFKAEFQQSHCPCADAAAKIDRLSTWWQVWFQVLKKRMERFAKGCLVVLRPVLVH